MIMNEQNQAVLENDVRQIDVEQVADDELTLALSHVVSNKEWQE